MGMKKKTMGARQTAADRKQLKEARAVLKNGPPKPPKKMVFGVIHEFGRDPEVKLFSSQKIRSTWLAALFKEYAKEYDTPINSAQDLIEASSGDVELCTFQQYLDEEQ